MIRFPWIGERAGGSVFEIDERERDIDADLETERIPETESCDVWSDVSDLDINSRRRARPEQVGSVGCCARTGTGLKLGPSSPPAEKVGFPLEVSNTPFRSRSQATPVVMHLQR
ncbi:MAG: hypothetical protein H0U18_01870 [Pyrinomonadaceae bacterium]|nr:hypothetical protein [Pyrinomonadaceae bacterium]